MLEQSNMMEQLKMPRMFITQFTANRFVLVTPLSSFEYAAADYVCVCFDLRLVGVVCQFSELSQLWFVLPHDILVLYPWRLWRYFLLST